MIRDHILDAHTCCCLACGARAVDIVESQPCCTGTLQYREYIRHGQYTREIKPPWKTS